MKYNKEYKTLSPGIIQLLDQLIISKELFDNAAGKVSDAVTADKIKRLLAKKKVFIKEATNILDIDLNQFRAEQQKNIDMKLQKVTSHFEDLFLNGNDIDLIAFLISTENKLQKLYHPLFRNNSFDDFVLMVFKNQFNESKRDMMELNKLQEEYI